MVVDNASTDGTRELAERLSAEWSGVHWTGLEEKGRGRALKKAWGEGGAKFLCYMDVDLSTDLGALPGLLKPLFNNEADLAMGSRLLPDSVTERSFKREWISRCYNGLVRSVFRTGISDFQCGFKAMTQRAAEDLLWVVEDNEWFFDTELLLVAEGLGYRIHEVPVEWREDADSRVRIFRTAVDDLKGLIRVSRRFHRGEILPDAHRRSAVALPRTGKTDPFQPKA